MTTKIPVHPVHWPVKVEEVNPGNGEVIATHIVQMGETRDFNIHSTMDIYVHEMQPNEVDAMDKPRSDAPRDVPAPDAG